MCPVCSVTDVPGLHLERQEGPERRSFLPRSLSIRSAVTAAGPAWPAAASDMHKPRTRRHGCPSMSTRRFVNLRRAGHAGPAACSRVIAGSTTSRRASPVEDPGLSAGVSGTPYATLHAKSVAECPGKRIILCVLQGWHGELRRVSPKLPGLAR